ncbi:MAG: GspE/PulE family protein [Bacteroidota bacterium]
MMNSVGSETTSSFKKRDLGDVLVEKGIVTPEMLSEAIKIMSGDTQKQRRNLPWILCNTFNVDRELLYLEVAKFYAFRILDISKTKLEDSHLAFIRREFNALPDTIKDKAIDHSVLPFSVDPNRLDRLLIATPDPTGAGAVSVARAFRYGKFEICYMPFSQWNDLWKRVAIDRSSYQQHVDESSYLQDESEEEAEQYEQALEDEISKSGLVELVEKIFVDGVRVGASDIHVIPRGEKVTEFHFRVDGKLSLWYTYTDARAEAVAAVVKDRAKNLDRFERNVAQDGFAQIIIDRKAVRYRLSVIPIVGKELKSRYESIVIRILQEPNLSIRIEELGFEPYAEQALRNALAKPHGIIIVTGPTGSGKSTTLVAALRTIMNPSVNIMTVEDPVEYLIEGGRQVKLNPKLDFEGALRAILRHDPDIIMVGEIRDRITADIAIKFANTGHLTLSTLHTNDAPSAISRLFKMGVEPFLIGYAINLILAQRLVRKLCPKCKAVIDELDMEALRKLGIDPDEIKQSKIYRPVGCGDCLHGYKGRIAIHEALYFYKNIRQIILRSDQLVDEDALRILAAKNGMQTLRQSAIELMKKGITSIEEVATVTMEDESQITSTYLDVNN